MWLRLNRISITYDFLYRLQSNSYASKKDAAYTRFEHLSGDIGFSLQLSEFIQQ